jgi:hypothetical protein
MIDGLDREKPRFPPDKEAIAARDLSALADLVPARMTLAFAGGRAGATSCSRGERTGAACAARDWRRERLGGDNLALVALTAAGRPRIVYFSGISSWPDLTRPSTRTLNHAIKAMIKLPKFEMTPKWADAWMAGPSQVRPGHDAEIRVFPNHLDRLRSHG